MYNIPEGENVMYYAIIGDIKNSKDIENRYEVQEKLKHILNNVNLNYKDNIKANFLITLGDEFQGLLSKSEDILEIVKYIQREMYPIKLRFGIGVGEISTKIEKKAAIGADGPAFYAARQMIDFLREEEKHLRNQAPDIQVAFYNKESFIIDEINMMLTLTKIIEDNWTDKQRYTIWDMMLNGGSQEICAKRMKTSQSTIARRLIDGKYLIYIKALKTIGEAMNRLGGNDDI